MSVIHIVEICLGAAAYTGVGIVVGSLITRNIWKRSWGASYNRVESARWWGYSSIFLWPLYSICAAIFGFVFVLCLGGFKMLDRLFVPRRELR